MSDDDMVEHEAGEAGASTWYPGEAGQVKKGGHILMKGDKPCKVIDIKVSKTGKHGHGKCRFTAIDIFDGSKHEDIIPSTHTAHLPFVNRAEYTVIGIEDGYLQMMQDDGEMKEDLTLPTYPEDLGSQLEEAIATAEATGKTVVVSVISAMEKEAVTSFKTVEV
jgi:translation initiation factor 5A